MAFDTSAYRMDIYELSRNKDMSHRIDWFCEITYNLNLYQVAWVCYFPEKEEDSPYGHWLCAWKDGERLDDFTDEGRMIFETASTLRAFELTHTRSESLSEDQMLGRFVDLANRALDGEFIGQRGSTYLSDIARVLQIPEYMAIEYGYRLREEGKIGLSGFILIEPERDARSRKNLEEMTGHKDYDQSEIGEMWWCRACGNKADLRDGPSPKDVPCVEA